MITVATVREIALAFEAAEEQPHFEITSFRVKKKIFVTLNFDRHHITIRLAPDDQAMFCAYNQEVVYPVPNAWGKQGWTHVNLALVNEELLHTLITLGYCQVAPKKLAAKYLEAPND
jgi:predicted DNA-binding protein (MmcQ/YjbR family)